MTDARWIEVEDDLASACRHFGNAALLHDEGGFERDDLSGYRASMALQHAMQSAHTSLESALARILEILGEEKPAGSDWHVTLVRRVSRPVTTSGHERPEILGPEIARDVDESRRFRHRATHGYDNFDPSLAAPSVEAARRLATTLLPAVEAFRRKVDPPSPDATIPENGGPEDGASGNSFGR